MQVDFEVHRARSRTMHRKELEALVRSRLVSTVPGHVVEQIVIDIQGLENSWEEMDVHRLGSDPHSAVSCIDCWIEEEMRRGGEVRVYFKPPRAVAARKPLKAARGAA
jgi:hypothetical protein